MNEDVVDDDSVYMVASQRCVAQYDGELSLMRGDVVQLSRSTLSNWDWSKNETRWLLAKHVRLQQTGFVNAIYLQARDDDDRGSADRSKSAKKPSTKARAHSVKKLAIPQRVSPPPLSSVSPAVPSTDTVHRTHTGPPGGVSTASAVTAAGSAIGSSSGSVTNKSIHARAHARLGLNVTPPASPLLADRVKNPNKLSSVANESDDMDKNRDDDDDDNNSDDRANGGKQRAISAHPLAKGRSVDHYILNDPQLSAIDDNDGSATHVFDDEEASPWHSRGPLSLEHSRAAAAALESVPYFQPSINRTVASAILHEPGQFLLREAEQDDGVSPAPQWEAFVVSFHDASDVRHFGVEFNAKSTTWRVVARDADRLRFGSLSSASSVDGVVVQLGNVLTTPYLRRQRADLRTRSGSSHSAFAEAEERPALDSAAPSPRVDVEVIDDVETTNTISLDGMLTRYGVLHDDDDMPLRADAVEADAPPRSTLRAPAVVGTNGTVVYGAQEATIVMHAEGDDESHSGDTDFSSAVFGTFVLRQFQEEQAREALAETQVVSERRRAEAGIGPIRRQVMPPSRRAQAVAVASSSSSRAPQRLAPAPAPNRTAPAPPPEVRVERDVLNVWKQLRPKPQNLPLLRPDVFLVARGPVTLMRRGKEPLPLRALLFNTYLLLCRSVSVSKSKHHLRCAVITRLTPTIKMAHTPGTRVFALIHPFRVFLLEARSEEAAATWASAIENAVAFAPVSQHDDAQSMRDIVGKAFDAVDLPSAAAREHLRLRPSEALAVQTTVANERLMTAYQRARTSRLRRLRFPVLSMSTARLQFSLETVHATLAVTFANEGAKRLYLSYQTVSESSDYRVQLSPVTGRLVVECGRSAQLFVALTVKSNRSPPPLLAYLPVAIIGGADLKHAQIGVLWICCESRQQQH